MEVEYDFIGVLAGEVAHCVECAQNVFGFEVVTAIFEQGEQGTFFFSLREHHLKSMLFPVCAVCGAELGQEEGGGC